MYPRYAETHLDSPELGSHSDNGRRSQVFLNPEGDNSYKLVFVYLEKYTLCTYIFRCICVTRDEQRVLTEMYLEYYLGELFRGILHYKGIL